MKRTEITNGRLDKVLRSLGFTCRLVNKVPPARRYEHADSTALFTMSPHPMSDSVFEHHFVAARTILDQFGIADPEVFDAKLQKAG